MRHAICLDISALVIRDNINMPLGKISVFIKPHNKGGYIPQQSWLDRPLCCPHATNVKYLKIIMNNIQFRNASERDIPEAYELESRYIKELEPINFHRWSNAKEINYNLLKSNIQNMFVAEHGGKVIGYSYWSTDNRVPNIFSIYVSQKYRSNGIARKLLSLVEKSIYLSKFDSCVLSTLNINPAIKLFRYLGYELQTKNSEWSVLKKHLTFTNE